MTTETFLNGRVTLLCGDSREVLKSIPDASIDSVVCDPPYALVSIVKRFGALGAAACVVPEGGSGAYARVSAGFMGKTWDTGETAFAAEFWAEVLRVLKPGGHLVASSGSRTVHRMVCAIEDAGFEIRDGLQWLYGSGFPKSHNVAKKLSKQLAGPDLCEQWEGWGTALKPAVEPICLARKPLDHDLTVAANVLRWRTGALNIDGCRVESGADHAAKCASVVGLDSNRTGDVYGEWSGARTDSYSPDGRWPANIIHDGSDEVLAAFPNVKTGGPGITKKNSNSVVYEGVASSADRDTVGYDDCGSAARFFYTAKADADDRLGSKHPTVKPVDLMQWLCRLVTPKGGTVLDPFAGTGTTAEAAFREGFNSIIIEREPEYQADIRRRMALVMAGPEERKRESIKAKLGVVPFEAGSLFAGLEEAAEQ
jgi:DNA modification methylase